MTKEATNDVFSVSGTGKLSREEFYDFLDAAFARPEFKGLASKREGDTVTFVWKGGFGIWTVKSLAALLKMTESEVRERFPENAE